MLGSNRKDGTLPLGKQQVNRLVSSANRRVSSESVAIPEARPWRRRAAEIGGDEERIESARARVLGFLEK